MATATQTKPEHERPTVKQRRMYFGLVKKLGLGDYERRLITQRMCRRRSTKSISRWQMTRLIQELIHLSGTPAGEVRPMARGGCSMGQVLKIRAQAYDLGWSCDPKRLAGFLRRMTVFVPHLVDGDRREVAGSIGTAKSDPEDLTSPEAMRVIEALKDMQNRRHNRRGAVPGSGE